MAIRHLSEISIRKSADAAAPIKNPGPFGILLRRWRRIRGLSQIELAGLSNASPRHVSFLETGRARPGKELIIELANTLRLASRDINALMLAAGFPPLYPEDQFAASTDMTLFQALINNLVHSTQYPCFVVDRLWKIRDVNRAMRALFQDLGTHYQVPDDKDVIDRILSQDSQASRMINFDEIVRQFVIRLRSEVSTESPDDAVEALIRKAESRIKHDAADAAGENLLTVPMTWSARFQIGEDCYSAVVGISRFSAAPHVEFSELRLVWLVPADFSSEQVLNRLLKHVNDIAVPEAGAHSLVATASVH